MKHQLRWYQQEAYKALILSLKDGKTPYVDLFPGLGKSLLMAALSNKAINQGLRVLQLVPGKELCEQNYAELFNYCDDKSSLGIVCSKLNRYDGHKKAVVAMVHSFLRRRFKYGKFDILIIDEVDLVSPDSKSMYQKIITTLRQMNPDIKIMGLTGSPFRQGIGALENDSELKGKATFTDCVWSSTPHLQRLIKEGYLANIISISGDIQADLSQVKRNSSGEYDNELMSVKFDAIVDYAVPDFIAKLRYYNIETTLIFASSLANARHITDRYKQITGLDNIRLVSGDMDESERKCDLGWLKNGTGSRIVVNVGVLLRGHNYPQLQCLVWLRATTSLNVWIQGNGRLTRPHTEKDCGYVIDYGTNIARLGPIDDIKPPAPQTKKSEQPRKKCTATIDDKSGVVKIIKEVEHRKKYGEICEYQNVLSAKKCELCGAVFVTEEGTEGKYSMRTHAEILKMKREAKQVHHAVKYVRFESRVSRSGGLMAVVCVINEDDVKVHDHFLCLDHSGLAKHNAHKFIKQWMRDPAHFQELTEDGLTSELFLDLVRDDDILDRYFKNITGIVLEPRQGNSKYFDVIQWEFTK